MAKKNLKSKFIKWAKKVKKDSNLKQVLHDDAVIVLNWIFATTEKSGLLRRRSFIGIIAFLWAWIASSITPFVKSPSSNFFSYPIDALFGAEVFRHVLVATLVFWLALQLAAYYLDDVFELSDIKLAERYILQAALADRYELIEIKEGKVLESHRDSTVVRIGGPGRVKVHLDSAALFESFNGDPIIISPADGEIGLARFDRLRKVVWLRDQIDEAAISARTRDGIVVHASGVRMKFHINRAGQTATLKTPYPFSTKAIKNLIYKEAIFKFIPTQSELAKNTDTSEPTTQDRDFEIFQIKSSPIQNKLRGFISSSTLGEFLAKISSPEEKKKEEESQQIDNEARTLVGDTQQTTTSSKPAAKKSGSFYTRDEITKKIYGDDKEKTPEDRELDWIDIGTWVLPPMAKEIAKKHEDAWILSLENLKNRNDFNMNKVRISGENKARGEVIEEILGFFHLHYKNNSDQKQVIQKMVHSFLQKFHDTRSLYTEQNQKPSENLVRVIHHLDEIINKRRWA